MKANQEAKKSKGGAVAMSILALAAMAAALPARAADVAEPRGDIKVQDRLTTQFTVFAGSESNARSLVTGLRTGEPVTLTETTSPGVVKVTTFDPPTRPMGNGNVRIALALAQEQLASQGITSPTSSEIHASLMGGTIMAGNPPHPVQLTGVLELRSQGMGWGQIAQAYGTKLGFVMSRLNSSRAESGPRSETALSRGAGIRTATGAEVRGRAEVETGETAASSRAAEHRPSNASGRGIVTATGAPVFSSRGGVSGRTSVDSDSSGAVVTAGGASAGAQARGAGKGIGVGHGRQ